jgi:transketolase
VSNCSWNSRKIIAKADHRQLAGQDRRRSRHPPGLGPFIGSDGIFVGMSSFGASAPGKDLYKHFGITAEAVVAAAEKRNFR